MVREKIHHPEMRTTYLLKPGQTVEDIRVSISKAQKLEFSVIYFMKNCTFLQPSERTRALIMTKGAFQRFVDYTTEEDRITTQQEKEAAKIAALKKATYEKSKTWDSKLEVCLIYFQNTLQLNKSIYLLYNFTTRFIYHKMYILKCAPFASKRENQNEESYILKRK